MLSVDWRGTEIRRFTLWFLIAFMLLLGTPWELGAQAPLTIEKLVSEGWEIAGYIAVSDNRSLILFKHTNNKFLVQCSVLIDVTRNPRVAIYCYELR